MHRRRLLSWASPIALLAAFVLAGCGGSSGEQQVLKKYFDASRLRDNTTLANIATVSFRPQEEGVIQTFSLVSVGEEQRRVLRIREQNAAQESIRKEEEEFSKRKKAFQDENLEAIDRVLRAERENRTLRGKDAEVQTEWTRWRDEMADYAKKVSDARQTAAAERSIAELSVYTAENPVNVGQYDGELITKDITIRANVRMPDDQSAEKQFVVTIERAELKNAAGDSRNGRWIITGIREVT